MQFKEEKNDAIGLVASALLHIALLAFLFFFFLHTPNPPLGGGSGVVLNLGYVDEGTGELQTLNDANESDKAVENAPQEPQPDPSTTASNSSEEDGNSKQEQLLTGQEESNISANLVQNPTDKIGEKSNTKIENTQTNDSKNNKAAPPLYGGKTGTATDGGNNNGDKVGKVGDQGNPNGQIDAKALYGNPGQGGNGPGGSGGGSSLDMAGWTWDKRPKVNEDSDESGRIVYSIAIDAEGEILDVRIVESTVSPNVEKIYRKEVEKLTFTKTDNKIPANRSTGRITFIIRSR